MFFVLSGLLPFEFAGAQLKRLNYIADNSSLLCCPQTDLLPRFQSYKLLQVLQVRDLIREDGVTTVISFRYKISYLNQMSRESLSTAVFHLKGNKGNILVTEQTVCSLYKGTTGGQFS